MNKTFAALAVGLAALSAAPAHALDYTFRIVGNAVVIDASGTIEINEAQLELAAVAASSPTWGGRKATAIVFNSTGGNVYGGFTLAALIRQYGLNTGVSHGGVCASACTLAWAAGRGKSVAPDASIGVHLPFATDGSDATNAQSAATSISVGAQMAQFLANLGAPPSVITALGSTAASNVHWLTPDELAQWNAKVTW